MNQNSGMNDSPLCEVESLRLDSNFLEQQKAIWRQIEQDLRCNNAVTPGMKQPPADRSHEKTGRLDGKLGSEGTTRTQSVSLGGRNLRIRGTDHTYQAIEKGTATIVECISCHAILQVGESAKLILCTHCQHLFPKKSSDETESGTPFLAQQSLDHPASREYMAEQRYVLDHEIATSMQQQEEDAACRRKLAHFSTSCPTSRRTP